MAKQYDCQQYINEWTKGKSWVDSYIRDFNELDNLADAVALSRTKGAPVVGDVTLAAAVRQIPRASIQQLPTFLTEVNGTRNSLHALVCDFIIRRVVFNEDTFGKGILSTMQIGAESALTHGFQVYMASLGAAGTDFGTSMKLVHYNDFVIEPGVFDAADSSYVHIRTRVTKSRLQALLKKAESNPETTWDVKALQDLINAGPTADSYAQYQSAPRYNPATTDADNTYDIITRYENKPYGEVCTFSPSLPMALRCFKSKSKFGYPRASFLVIDPAQLTPFGVSRVRLASPTANYANIYLQSTAKMLLLNADPPVLQRGQFSAPIKMKRGALWQAIDPQAEAKIQELSNSTLVQFRNVLEFADNQIYSIMGVTAGTVGNGNVDPNYSKTSAGVKMEQSTRDLSTTQITNILENQLRQHALTALDLFISEQVGETPLIVDDQCKNALNRLKEGTVGDDNTIIINWSDFYAAIHTWTVDIDLSMSKQSMNEKERADIQDMLTVMSQTADPADPVAKKRIRELEDLLLEKTVPAAKRLGMGMGAQEDPDMAQEGTEAPMPEGQEQEAPSPTAVQGPNGQLHESADLVKLYATVGDVGVRQQILQALGFTPTMEDTPVDQQNLAAKVVSDAQKAAAPKPASNQ